MALTKVKGSVLPDIFPGVIWMFAGTEEQIEDGWQLCNGTGTTSNGIQIPDLQDRFVVGSGSTYDTGDTGGSTSETTSSDGSHSHTVTVDSDGDHSHTVTVNSTTLTESQMPSHYHREGPSYPPHWCRFQTEEYTELEGAGQGGGGHSTPYTENTGSSSSHSHTASTNNTGSHIHTASTGSTGSHDHTVDILPPYYALAFIIKL